MYIVEEEADDPEGKKRRQVILKRAGLQGSTEASDTGATGTELSGSGGPGWECTCSLEWGCCGNSASAKAASADPWDFPL